MKKMTFKPKQKDFLSEPDLVFNDIKDVISNERYWYIFTAKDQNIHFVPKSSYNLSY